MSITTTMIDKRNNTPEARAFSIPKQVFDWLGPYLGLYFILIGIEFLYRTCSLLKIIYE
jgi:hypothetical protein